MAQVLIVDDDPDLRTLLHTMLHAEGHTILKAADGVEALETLGATVVPLIVLLHGQMPWLDGFDVLQAVAADLQLRTAHRFGLVTATDWQQPERCALLAPLQVPVIAKPFDLTTVTQAVNHARGALPRDYLPPASS